MSYIVAVLATFAACSGAVPVSENPSVMPTNRSGENESHDAGGCSKPSDAPTSSIVMSSCGNGEGGNDCVSSMNVLDGGPWKDRTPNACLLYQSGNGDGGNNVTSKVNMIKGGSLLCLSGNGRGGNVVRSLCNIVVGNGANLLSGCNGTIIQSLCNLVIGSNCSMFGHGCHDAELLGLPCIKKRSLFMEEADEQPATDRGEPLYVTSDNSNGQPIPPAHHSITPTIYKPPPRYYPRQCRPAALENFI